MTENMKVVGFFVLLFKSFSKEPIFNMQTVAKTSLYFIDLILFKSWFPQGSGRNPNGAKVHYKTEYKTSFKLFLKPCLS